MPVLSVLVVAMALAGSGLQRQDLPLQVTRDAKYWEWRSWPWTVEDQKVSATRKSIDELADRGSDGLDSIESIAAQSKRQFESQAKPNVQPLITWTYAAYRANILDPKSWKRTSGSLAEDLIEKVPPIPSYEYARTRFLAMSDTFPKEYVVVGKRLLTRDPKDYSVKHALVRLLNPIDSIEAKRLCAELVRDWPSKVNVFALMGDTYYLSNMKKANRDDLLGAKKYYEIFLQKAPSSNRNLPLVRWRLEKVKKKLEAA